MVFQSLQLLAIVKKNVTDVGEVHNAAGERHWGTLEVLTQLQFVRPNPRAKELLGCSLPRDG